MLWRSCARDVIISRRSMAPYWWKGVCPLVSGSSCLGSDSWFWFLDSFACFLVPGSGSRSWFTAPGSQLWFLILLLSALVLVLVVFSWFLGLVLGSWSWFPILVPSPDSWCFCSVLSSRLLTLHSSVACAKFFALAWSCAESGDAALRNPQCREKCCYQNWHVANIAAGNHKVQCAHQSWRRAWWPGSLLTHACTKTLMGEFHFMILFVSSNCGLITNFFHRDGQKRGFTAWAITLQVRSDPRSTQAAEGKGTRAA